MGSYNAGALLRSTDMVSMVSRSQKENKREGRFLLNRHVHVCTRTIFGGTVFAPAKRFGCSGRRLVTAAQLAS